MIGSGIKKSNWGYYLSGILLFLSCSPSPEKNRSEVFTIEIRQMQFHPAELKVKKGDTVVFINRDFITHDVTEQLDKSWTSAPLTSGKSWSMVVTGTVDYYCSIHPVMKGRLIEE